MHKCEHALPAIMPFLSARSRWPELTELSIADAPVVSQLPASANGFVTFGSFNNLAKITPQVMAVWASILHAVPSSRLLLKNKPFACAR